MTDGFNSFRNCQETFFIIFIAPNHGIGGKAPKIGNTVKRKMCTSYFDLLFGSKNNVPILCSPICVRETDF